VKSSRAHIARHTALNSWVDGVLAPEPVELVQAASELADAR
jgi:hypothetical protein